MFVVHEVLSNQSNLHPRLDNIVEKHLQHVFLRLPGSPTQQAFACLQPPTDRPWLLDAGCGTGESSDWLARERPDAWILGIDKSAARLGQSENKLPDRPDNLCLLRADLIDFALLAAQAGWQFEQLNLFYPNPWPKSEHLQRRWHGHAIFPTLLQLAPRIELRSNWLLYLQEFARALELAGWQSEIQAWQPEVAVTAFERKYSLAGQSLYRLTAQAERAQE